MNRNELLSEVLGRLDAAERRGDNQTAAEYQDILVSAGIFHLTPLGIAQRIAAVDARLPMHDRMGVAA